MDTQQMVDMQNYSTLCNLFDRYHNFALSTHINPDGDAIGSELGLYLFLTGLGKSVKMFNTDAVPANYRFLPFWDSIESTHSVGSYCPEVLIVLDASTLERIGKALSKTLLPTHCLINIDHHATAETFGDINLIVPSASSTSEIVYKLIKYHQTPIDKACALCLYTGLMFDTGCFRHSNTTAETHQIAAELIEIGGFAPDEVYRNVYEHVPVAKIHLLSEVLRTLEVTDDGKIASVYVTQTMFRKTGTTADAVEGIVNQIQAIAGVEVALCASEMMDRSTKVSLRSQGCVDVSQLAAEFEGGGHARAAGCRITMPYLLAIAALIQAAQRYIHPSHAEQADCQKD
ncbi:MAG: bifunctional oligoribonuclease/PAP phosphatase NrnA [Candidatus Poribacteria bacterium]|nr:bifunctional oligoribonuclease/PAP phosphatase NrnA [Candidatus Poribacteria bacterium]